MFVAIICAVVAIACLTQGAVEGAIALGILSAFLFFMFGSNTTPKNRENVQPKSTQEKDPQPASQYRATPSQVAHYRSSPVVAQIVREIRKTGAEERLTIECKDGSGYEFSAGSFDLGGGYYKYVFKDHGYQPLNPQEQEAFLLAIVEQLPYAETYKIGYNHREHQTTVPLSYFATTSFYRDNHYRWNSATRAWEKMIKL